ncbi:MULTISPECIES: hypothetical protein [Bacteroides]|nr:MULTISPECIES: hypothetical protein [Bacteroides]MBM6943968.1 hypothetical protein [Bacteroides gallinaceum]
MDKETKIPKLSKDEAGKLRGGFSIESAKVETMLELSDAACLYDMLSTTK